MMKQVTGIKLSQQDETSIREAIRSYENLADKKAAESNDAQAAHASIKRILSANSLEYCSHNLALLGSRRYAKYLIKERKGNFITCQEWAEYAKATENLKNLESISFEEWEAQTVADDKTNRAF